MLQPAGKEGMGSPDPETSARKALDTSLYPFVNKYAPIGGHQYHYVDEGEGPPVVMIHGNPTWSFYYRNLITALKPRYRVIAPDHIGMGLSSKPDDTSYVYTASQRLKDLEEFIDYLQLDRFTLVGHDWGGLIGTGYAALNPERIAGMVMLNTAGFIWPVNKRLPLALSLARFPLLSALFIRGLNAFVLGAIMLGMTRQRMSTEVARGYIYPYQSWNERRSVHRFIQDIPVRPDDPGYDLGTLMEGRLKLLRDHPLFLGWGMKDFVFCGKILDEWIRHFPQAEVHRIPDGGHYILEDAADVLIPRIKTFLYKKIVHGPAAPAPQTDDTAPAGEDFVSLNDHLTSLARAHPDKPVVVQMVGMKNGKGKYASLTYAEVDRESNRIAHGLEKVGIKKGMHTVLMVTPSTEFFCLLTGIFKIGAIPVFVDPGMGIRNLKKCIEEAEPEAFIGIPRAHAARVMLRWARKTIRINVTVGKKLFWGGYTLNFLKQRGTEAEYLMDIPRPDDMQMIAFTSGNTGVPKGVIFTQRLFVSILRFLHDFTKSVADQDPARTTFPMPEDADLSTFPPFALMGPGMGLPAVIPDMDATKPGSADPRKLIAAINDQQCTSMFASPALIEKIGRYCDLHHLTLPSLRGVFSAGAPVRLSSLERFVKALRPGVEVYTPYGATEALPVSIIGSRELLTETRQITREGGGVCVGRPIEGVDVAVIPVSDEPIPEWSESLRLPANQMGEITVTGPTVTKAYYKREQQNRLAKIHDSETGAVWHRMGDVGYFDDQGRLWMCGRKGHRVDTGMEIFYSLPCEAIFDNHSLVDRSALVGVRKNDRVQPVIVIQLEKKVKLSRDEQRLLTGELLEMATRYEHTRSIQTVLYHPRFPVDVRHNAKIVREELALWAQKEIT